MELTAGVELFFPRLIKGHMEAWALPGEVAVKITVRTLETDRPAVILNMTLSPSLQGKAWDNQVTNTK